MSEDLSISFGGYITAAYVRNAVQNTIAYWSHTYLAEMARHDGQDPMTPGGMLPDFASYPDSLDLSKFPEEQLPACVLVVPGIKNVPEKTGRGALRATWIVGIGICVTGQNKSDTIKLAQLYTTAVRLLILQNRSLGNFATGVEWMREEFTGSLVHANDARTLAIGTLEFAVGTDSVADVSQGPLTPIPDNEPVTGWPTVLNPSVTITGSSPS